MYVSLLQKGRRNGDPGVLWGRLFGGIQGLVFHCSASESEGVSL